MGSGTLVGAKLLRAPRDWPCLDFVLFRLFLPAGRGKIGDPTTGFRLASPPQNSKQKRRRRSRKVHSQSEYNNIQMIRWEFGSPSACLPWDTANENQIIKGQRSAGCVCVCACKHQFQIQRFHGDCLQVSKLLTKQWSVS